MFIPASALLGMRSIYIGQLVRPAAAPLMLRMCVYIGSSIWNAFYLYRATSAACSSTPYIAHARLYRDVVIT